jgi:hypothetical protein
MLTLIDRISNNVLIMTALPVNEGYRRAITLQHLLILNGWVKEIAIIAQLADSLTQGSLECLFRNHEYPPTELKCWKYARQHFLGNKSLTERLEKIIPIEVLENAEQTALEVCRQELECLYLNS